MDHRPACSVIVPTYNRCGLLRLTLESLTRQLLPAERFEVIVVDDGSTDTTADLVRSFGDRLRLRYFFQPDEGYRVARARNIGIAHATSPLCIFLDSGVIAGSGCLSAHLRSHASSPDPIAVCGYVYGFDQGDENADRLRDAVDPTDPDGAISALRASGDFPDVRETFYRRHPDLGRLPAPWVVYWTCNASARTGQLRAVGQFDERYRSWGGEDIDLGYRLHRDGAAIVLDRAAAAVHWPHPKDRDANLASHRRNLRQFIDTYPDPVVATLRTVPLMRLNAALLSDSAD